MQKTQNLQDAFLNYIRREKIPVTLFLMNGFNCAALYAALTASSCSSTPTAGSR